MSRGASTKGDPNPVPAARDELRYAMFVINREIRHIERILEGKHWTKLIYQTTYQDMIDARQRFDGVVYTIESAKGSIR